MKLTGAGKEGASTEFTDPIKIKQLRTEARDRLSMLKLKKTQGYVEWVYFQIFGVYLQVRQKQQTIKQN